MSENLKNGSRWGVTAMISEPPQLVMAFVAHHLLAGADRVIVHLDTPDPALEARLAKVPGCQVVPVTSKTWGPSRYDRPNPPSGRQRRLLEGVLEETDLDWIFHLDADEFLMSQRPISALLAEVDRSVDWLFVDVAERVHATDPDPDNIFDGIFRRSFPPQLDDSLSGIDGPASAFLDRGLSGYPGGKSAYRPGRGIEPDIHAPANQPVLKKGQLPDTRVLHFDGLTGAHWVWKKRRVIAQQPAPKKLRASIAAQRAALEAAATDAEAEAIYDQMKRLSPPRLAALQAQGRIETWDIDPRRAAWQIFGPETLDFSVAAFDPTPVPVTPYRKPSLWSRVIQGLKRRWPLRG